MKKPFLFAAIITTYALAGCAHQIISTPDVAGPSEFVFPTYPAGTPSEKKAQSSFFRRYTENKDGGITNMKNDLVRYEVGVQWVRLASGCFKTTSRKIGIKVVKTMMTTTNPPTPIENVEPVLKIETIPIDCSKHF